MIELRARLGVNGAVFSLIFRFMVDGCSVGFFGKVSQVWNGSGTLCHLQNFLGNWKICFNIIVLRYICNGEVREMANRCMESTEKATSG